jgi:ATP-dependent Lhr-like helicase
VGRRSDSHPLALFHAAVRDWFSATFPAPTDPQALAWPAIARGDSTLLLAPTGSGKTLSAFLWCLDRIMFSPSPDRRRRCRVLYVSPLKALAVDVERNLRAPLAGIAHVAARRGDAYHTPQVFIRTGDTPASERARFQRHPADILITTPESLYLLLTSNARETLRGVDTIIIDEIHALVPTKRGAHLAVSVERLAAITDILPQRIGLSATQRPLDEVARFLGGVEPRAASGRGRARVADANQRLVDEFAVHEGTVRYRPVTVVDTAAKKALRLRIEVPLDNMARPPASAAGGAPSVWAAIYPRLLELIRSHASTLIFVNNRRLAERLSAALNELAGETLARSHHGSLAHTQRAEVEELLKAGALRALVATSSLELGIDMGAIDLVVQIESPPSVASGLQRIGRAGHQAGAVSEGVIFPKFRGDLVAAAAVARAMREGAVESTRYPRNPLDVAAQQIVAMTAMEEWPVEELFATLRRAAPFAELSRSAFDGVLDMLSGRYPSDEFAELRPRVTWNRSSGTVVAREGARRVAVANAGTIPDRGLFGVFLLGAPPGAARVGELDEEMVFESAVGDTFVLGASSWRIDAITHDRVLVTPAPGEPGKMPFWRGDRAGRPLELGLAIGRLTRDLLRLKPDAAIERLTRDHDLDARAAANLMQYLQDQIAAARAVPDAGTILIERVRDDLGDWRVCVLSPRGGRVHAPWAMAAAARIGEETGLDVETLWGDDGFVVRFPDVDRPPDPQLLVPAPDEVQALVVRQLGATSLFAARFRENAARSLLLPRRRPGGRTPLWQQRKRSADLLAVAARFGSFPVLLETYRDCLRDYFDLPALVSTLTDIRSRKIRVVTVDSDRPSPFAASLLFTYVASFLYDGDAPLAERRAQALAVDQAQLRELIGDAELRELVDEAAVAAVERQLQRLDERYRARSADGVHDLLLTLGDLDVREIAARATPEASASVTSLVRAGRILAVTIGTTERYIAVEDAARYRDAVGVQLAADLPDALLEPVRDPLGDLALRYARTHAPFPAGDFAGRYAIALSTAEEVLTRLTVEGRLLQGEFRPGGILREWTDRDVLQRVRRRSLSRLRREVEPVDHAAFARFTTAWHGIGRRRQGADALLDVVEQLQGAPLPASILETEILPARVERYDPADLDAIMAAGEIVWAGIGSLGERDGRVALYLADRLPDLHGPQPDAQSGREAAIVDYLHANGASFFGAIHEAAGGGYPGETVTALWNLVWEGLITNDTMHALRAYTRIRPRRRQRPAPPRLFRSRQLVPPSAEGRWRLAVPVTDRPRRDASRRDRTRRAAALAQQLLSRHGVLTREAIVTEALAGGFSALYPILKSIEESGRLRRGYFVAGLGASQFALPGALDLLRTLRDAPPADVEMDDRAAILAATDPANPYGAAVRFPASSAAAASRTVGASVLLVDGALVAYLARGDRSLLTWLPPSEPERSHVARHLARLLDNRAQGSHLLAAGPGDDEPSPGSTLSTRGMLIEEIDGIAATAHPLARYLAEAGFIPGALGFQARRIAPRSPRE